MSPWFGLMAVYQTVECLLRLYDNGCTTDNLHRAKPVKGSDWMLNVT
jgi:hypothetical protein